MKLEYTYWNDGDGWLIGYLNIWPDHWTQGKGIAELEEMLLDLYQIYKEEKDKKPITRQIQSESHRPYHNEIIYNSGGAIISMEMQL